MTTTEYATEHAYIYAERLGMMGLTALNNPTADQHNSAVAEADTHIAALKSQERSTAIEPLLDFRNSL